MARTRKKRGHAINDSLNNEGITALFIASRDGDLNEVRRLLTHGANANKVNNKGVSPLYIASQNRHLYIVKLLLEAGADVNKSMNDGATPLFIASQKGYIDIVKALLEAGADKEKCFNGGSPLYTASQNGHVEVVKVLLEAGADKDKTMNGVSPLFIASQKGYIDIVKALLEAGADKEKCFNGGSPLYTASQNGHVEVVKVLLEAGADKDKTMNEVSPLFIASNNGHIDVVKALLEAGVDKEKAMNNGATPLIIASQNGHITIVKALLEAGANVNKSMNNGTTPLYTASFKGHLEVVKALLEAGADKNIASNGRKPIDVAKTEEIKKLLEDPVIEDTTLWNGWSLSDDKMLDILFTDDGAKNATVCPICLKHAVRQDGCMYMHHNCKALNGFYHQDLYAKYKNAEGEVEWCTFCGRICKGHRHYETSKASGPVPGFAASKSENANVFFQNDCRGANGGGGIPEKIERFRVFRHQARELESEKGSITRQKAMEELVEVMWNAPLIGHFERKTRKILEEKRWNFPGEGIFQNTNPINENETNAPNIARNAANATLLPKLTEGMNVVSLENGPVVEFVHRRRDGTVNEHKGEGINMATLKDFITRMNSNFGTEEFGYCWNYGTAPDSCTARLHPDEVKAAFELLGEPNEALVAEYRRKFNRKFRVGGRRTRKY